LQHRIPGNLAQNSSFEHNWFHRKFAEQRRFLLLQSSDLGVGEQDGHIDHWRLEGVTAPDCWDVKVARTGSRSLRFDAAGRARQWIRGAGEQFWETGGAHYQDFLPMARPLADRLPRRPIVVGAWCRAAEVPTTAPPRIELRVECATRPGFPKSDPPTPVVIELATPFSAGTHEWEYREVRIDPAKLPGTPIWIVGGLVSGGGGRVWFDDFSCLQPDPDSDPSLLQNGGFEESAADGWPRGWSRPALWTWFRSDYYLFTGWTHSERRDFRGAAAADPSLAFTGSRSLRFTVYPGDNFAVSSEPLVLGQQAAAPIELRAMVKADRVRTLELMAQDERGDWLPQGDFLGDDMEDNPNGYRMGTTGSGTYDWHCVRKYLSPRRPVGSLRVFLCARGFDGERVERNQVGTVWWDDVQARDHRPGGRPQAAADAAPPPLRVLDEDPGERLWGRNRLRLELEVADPQLQQRALSVRPRLDLVAPSGKTATFTGNASGFASEPLPARIEYQVPYEVRELCRSAREQYRLTLRLEDSQGALIPARERVFGMPSRLVEAGLSAYYLYAGESVTAYARLNLSAASLGELARLEIRRGPGQEPQPLRVLRGSVGDFAVLERPQTGPDYADTARLLQISIAQAGLPVRPWQTPVRDQTVTFRLIDAAGAPLTEATTPAFGYLERVPAPDLPATIQRTAVDARGHLRVNGVPFFPVFWSPHFGIVPEATYHPRPLGFRCVDLTDLVLGANRPPDAGVKARLQAKVREVRGDPKLFQYELGDGEMQLQGRNWRQRLAWLKTAIPWIREADPNHLINGPESWLVGHPGHNQALPAFTSEFDAVGVEASFETVPELRRLGLGVGERAGVRPSAILVGLEGYFYQSPEVLRWRGYRAVLEGAAGVGLCPSGMLQARPDYVNFLRGLNAEFRGLAPLLLANAPTARTTTTNGSVELFERELDGKRTLIVTRKNPTETTTLELRFAVPGPTPLRRVTERFSGRVLDHTGSGFHDRWSEPALVRVYILE
jgi:hypothetical protein